MSEFMTLAMFVAQQSWPKDPGVDRDPTEIEWLGINRTVDRMRARTGCSVAVINRVVQKVAFADGSVYTFKQCESLGRASQNGPLRASLS